MFTRKMKQTSTQQSKIRETQKKPKVMPNPISKKQIRKIIKDRLSIKTSLKSKAIKPAFQVKEAKSKEDILKLIDQSKCECPICLQIAIHPIVLPCGHCYCLKCFEENSIFNLRCCLCRMEVDAEEIQSAKMVQTFINNYILPTSSEGINYWCRQGEFREWEGRRKIDLQALRPGDSIDVRTEDNSWRRGVIVCSLLLSQQNEYCMEIKYCQNAKIENILVPTSSRKLAPCGFFTKGQYLKYRTVNYESKFVESIEIPEIKCDFIDQSRSISVREQKWSQNPRDQQQNHELALELFQFEMKEWENVFQLN